MHPHTNGPLFQGIGVALVTLFDEDGRILVDETADLAARVVERGVKAVLVAGSTGEPWALDANERVTLCEAVRAQVPSDIPILLGTGSFSTWEATVALTRACVDAPADALLIMPPPGVAADPEHYEQLRVAANGKPVWAYHVPYVSSPGVPVDVTAKLDVDALKDSSGDADRLSIEVTTGNGRPLYTGSPAALSLGGALKIAGAILALGQTVPELCAAAFDGDAAAQAEVARLHVDSLADFPAHFKKTVADVWGTSTAVRPRPEPARQ
jgi:4-hydroxy-tetrahydrodipicolinate synthase